MLALEQVLVVELALELVLEQVLVLALEQELA